MPVPVHGWRSCVRRGDGGRVRPILLEIRPVAAEAAIRFLAVAKGPVRVEAQVEGNANDLVAAVKTDGKSCFRSP
jgi:hypothetical protein